VSSQTIRDLSYQPQLTNGRQQSSNLTQMTETQVNVKVKVTLRLTVNQSVYLDVEPILVLMTMFVTVDDCCCVFVGRPL
jgi:hypothetical protein